MAYTYSKILKATSAGVSTGPFDVYFDEILPSNLIINNVSRTDLLSGITINIPNYATSLLVISEGYCAGEEVIIPLTPVTTTTTSTTTTTTTPAPTTTTTTSTTTSTTTIIVPLTTTTTTTSTTTTTTTIPCGVFNTFNNGTTINYSGTGGYQEIISTGTITINCPNTIIYLTAFSGTGGSTTEGLSTIVNQLGTGYGNYALDTGILGPSGGVTNTTSVVIALPGTYNVVIDAKFNPVTNPPTTSNYVSLHF